MIRARLRTVMAMSAFDRFVHQPGRWSKRHPLDCGHARCVTCHYAKLTGQPRIVELRAEKTSEEAE